MKTLLFVAAMLLFIQSPAQALDANIPMQDQIVCRMLHPTFDGGYIVVLSSGGENYHETARLLENQIDFKPSPTYFMIRTDRVGNGVHFFDAATKGERFSLFAAGLPLVGKSVRATLNARTGHGSVRAEMICLHL